MYDDYTHLKKSRAANLKSSKVFKQITAVGHGRTGRNCADNQN